MTRPAPQTHRLRSATGVACGALTLLALAAAACSDSHGSPLGHEQPLGPYVPPDPSVAQAIQVPPPPFSDGVFPCSDCHDDPEFVNRNRRTLSMAHQEIVLTHAEGQRWCLDCHDADDRDQLHLANGELVPFEESYRLCGQCHGDKLRDWKAGVHGRRTGSWSGEKQYLLCVHCHNAHDPRFPPMQPEPAPIPPRRTP